MSSVNNTTQNSIQTYARSSATANAKADAAASPEAEPVGDSVEISAEARALMNPEKTMNVGSEEYKKFRSLMDTVKQQKSGVMSRIEETLQKKGIDLAGLGTLKIEVDKAGRVIVGGIEDKKLAAKIEKALNEDKGLASEIAEYQKNEKELSKQVKDYTGCTLYELTMTAKGNVNERVRSEIEQDGKYSLGADYFKRLGFLGSAQSFIDTDDVAALSFNGNIDFSGEISVMSDPEGGIREAMEKMFGKVGDAFDNANAELRERLKAAGMDEETIDKHLLDAGKASITIDSRGQIKVEGTLSGDDATNRLGLQIIEQMAREMLLEVGTNSYGVNLFTAASQGLIDRKQREEGGGSDAKVVARMENGSVRDIYVQSHNSKTELERQLQNTLKKASAHVRK